MSVWDWLLLLAVVTALVLAIRGMRKQRGCSGNCSACTGCTAKAHGQDEKTDVRSKRGNRPA